MDDETELTSACEPTWTVWHTPYSETRVQKAIEAAGFGTFIPIYRQVRVVGGAMWDTRSLPIMAGYVLVAIEQGDTDWPRIGAHLHERHLEANLLGRIRGKELQRIVLAHLTGECNETIHQARASNGRFAQHATQPRRKQKKRRPRPRPGKRLSVSARTCATQPTHAMSAAQ